MKRKNPYILLCVLWSVLAVACHITFIVFLIKSNLLVALLSELLSTSFAFTAGRLFQESLFRHRKNKILDAYDEMDILIDELLKEELNEPFKEFEVPFPEVKKKEQKNG